MIFWKGHVAIAISKYRLIHAYGPKKKVVEMNINKTIERIKKTANLNVTSIRRIQMHWILLGIAIGIVFYLGDKYLF